MKLLTNRVSLSVMNVFGRPCSWKTRFRTSFAVATPSVPLNLTALNFPRFIRALTITRIASLLAAVSGKLVIKLRPTRNH